MFKQKIVLIIPLIIFLALIILLWRGLQLDPHVVSSTMIGKPMPEFSLPQLQNSQQRITTQDLKGQVFLLNVFASWCVACEQEHPLLMDIANHYKFPIIGLDYKDSDSAAMEVLKELDNPYQLVLVDRTGTVAID